MKLVNVKWEKERPNQFSFPNSAVISAKVGNDSHLETGTKIARLVCPDTHYGQNEIEVNFSISGVRDSSPFDGLFGVTDEYLNIDTAQPIG